MKASRFERALAAFEVCALTAVLLALRAGAPTSRWRAVAIFLAVGVLAALYHELGHFLVNRRAKRQSTAAVPRDVWLRTPEWIPAIEAMSFLSLGVPFAGIAAACGFPSVGVGILATTTGIAILSRVMYGTLSVTALIFAEEGLRVRVRGATLLVPWNAITDVQREGPEHHRLVVLHLVAVDAIIKSIQPATEQTRFRAAIIVGSEDGLMGKLTFPPWTAGLDGAALARALIASSSRDEGGAN